MSDADQRAILGETLPRPPKPPKPFSHYGITAVDTSTWGPVETIARPEAAPTAVTPLVKDVWCQVELPANRERGVSRGHYEGSQGCRSRPHWAGIFQQHRGLP